MNNLELDALIAEQVMGEARPTYSHEPHIDMRQSEDGNWMCYGQGDLCQWLPLHFSDNIYNANLVEDRIIKLQLIGKYTLALVWVVLNIPETSSFFQRVRTDLDLDEQELFAIIHATAEQRCRAALKAVGN